MGRNDTSTPKAWRLVCAPGRWPASHGRRRVGWVPGPDPEEGFPVRLGLDVAQHHLEWPEILARVRLAEEAGFDGAWVVDHFRPPYGPAVGPPLGAWTLPAGRA